MAKLLTTSVFARKPVFFAVVLAILLAAAPFESIAEAASGEAPHHDSLLQFTSSGHVLAFGIGGVIIAGPRYMLRTEFANADRVSPQAGEGSTPEVCYVAPPLGRVTYSNLWGGIDLVFEADEGAIAKSTYYLDDGSAVESIRLRYSRPVELDEQGNLLVAFDTGTMVESPPVAWQVICGEEVPVAVSYHLHDEGEVGFTLGDFESGVPVIIDPWLTFLGGGASEVGYGIAVDDVGNVYVTGESYFTWGTPVRAYTSGSDSFVAKLNSCGELLWHTFLGGTGLDLGSGIAVDELGNVYATGQSDATWGDSPKRPYTSDSDAFVAKLNSDGELQWHAFLGGDDLDRGDGIAVDGSGNVHVTGRSHATWGTPMRAYTPGWLPSSPDAFAAKLDGDGELLWNTFLGGNNGDEGWGIVVDATGSVYVTGIGQPNWGDAPNPVRAHTAGNDAFAAKLSSSGVLQWYTFLGGNAFDYGRGIAIDGSSNVYVTGVSEDTWGDDPVRAHAGGWDAFAAKLNISGELMWHTFLGSSGSDWGRGIAVDSSGNVYSIGDSDATWGDDPVRAHAGGKDAFAAKLNSSGVLQWHTFLGSSANDWGYGTAVDDARYIFIAGASNSSWGTPVRAYSAGTDALAIRLHPTGRLTVPTMVVSGNGVGIENGDMAPSLLDHTDFGDANATTGSVVRTFTINNTGNEDLTLLGAPKVFVGGDHASDFSVSTHPLSPVVGGGSTTFEVTFGPSAKGVRSATITIENNDPDEDPYVFAIQGRGTVVVTVSGITAEDKLYDGSTAAMLDVSGSTLVGVLGEDSVTLNTSAAVGTFADAEVGVDKTVTVSGLFLEGENCAYYTLVLPTTSASIGLPIPLSTGWNMVSVPLALDPEYDAPGDVFPGAVAVYTWDPVLKSYVVPDSIVPDCGYWAAVTGDVTIGVFGNPVTNWTKDLTGGWNMIGSVYGPPVGVNYLSDNPPSSVQTSAIYWWNPESKSYDTASHIVQGKGFWVAATEDCELTMVAPPA